MILGVELFALSPHVRHLVHRHSARAHLLGTLGLALLTSVSLLLLATAYGWMLAATYAGAIVTVSFICPWVFKARLRTHKNVIVGPWDVATLSSGTSAR